MQKVNMKISCEEIGKQVFKKDTSKYLVAEVSHSHKLAQILFTVALIIKVCCSKSFEVAR